MSWISALNSVALDGMALAWPMLWQSTLLIAGVYLLLQILFRNTPRLRHLLWSVVALKLLILPLWQWTFQLPSTNHDTTIVTATADRLEKIGAVVTDAPSPLTAAQMYAIAAKHLEFRRQQQLQLAQPPIAPVVSKSPEIAPAAIPQNAPLSEPLSWQSILFLFWAAGAITVCLNWIRNWWKLGCLLRRSQPASAEHLASLVALAKQNKLWRTPALKITDENCSPFICGWWQPTIVLPRTILNSLSPTDLEGILLHELAHLWRGDLYTRWLPEFAHAFYWFNPFVRLLRREVQLEAELACDQLVLRNGSVSHADYAQTIVQVVSHLSQPAWIAETQTSQS